MKFPAGFHFGASTSSYQIEGCVESDGRRPSIWDRFSHRPGNINDDSNGDIACDHYRRWASDIELMRDINLNAYRFSVAWPRILPKGTGTVNTKGLDFYDRLVDRLIANGIKPYLTLYHWDLPMALADRGGWQSRDTSSAFAELCDVVSRRLGDRVHSYATLNEPRCSAMVGYYEGRHAPGEKSLAAALSAAHKLLLAHGLGVQALRANLRTAKVGIVVDVKPYYAADDAILSVENARLADQFFNHWFLDPIYKGRYPQECLEHFRNVAPEIGSQDFKVIQQRIDSVGVNYYTRSLVTYDPLKPYPHLVETPNPNAQYTAMKWEVYPQGLYEMLLRLHKQYKIKDLYIAENGAAYNDTVNDGVVLDKDRANYIEQHLNQVYLAIQKNIPVSAYLAWSLLDNFEWGHGYSKRFGLYYVDYATQKRIKKYSAEKYAEFIASQV